MKPARLVYTVVALTMISGWASWSYACDNNKSTAAAAASKAGVCTAEMAAKCTPEMAAACKASMAAGGPDLCLKMKASAASANGACTMKGMNTSAAAVTAAATTACAAKGAATAAASGTCVTKSMNTSAGAGQCTGHGLASMAALSAHTDCEACADMADCSVALDAAGAHRQTVRLKNGIMYVYTADSPRSVSAVQAAMARRSERMTRLASAGEKVRLCDECKAMRGAMASGKLNREVVNIEGGSLTLFTSNDPAVVAKIHAMTDEKVAARTKS